MGSGIARAGGVNLHCKHASHVTLLVAKLSLEKKVFTFHITPKMGCFRMLAYFEEEGSEHQGTISR